MLQAQRCSNIPHISITKVYIYQNVCQKLNKKKEKLIALVSLKKFGFKKLQK